MEIVFCHFGVEMRKSHVNRRGMGFWKPVLAIVLAGGRGQRLGPLTEFRCKPALPVGKNRLIDFALATVINSKVVDHGMILTQYMQEDLNMHLGGFTLNVPLWSKSVHVVPAQKQFDDDSWYEGTANAVYQNRNAISEDDADTVIILAADHIYKLDIRQMHMFHFESGADFTACGMIMPAQEAAGNFGVMELDEDSRIVGFEEKPLVPKSVPGRPGESFASMGMYMVNKKFLLECLEEDHADPNSKHDFGNDVIPRLVARGASIYGYDYNENEISGEVRIEDGKEVQSSYWRDVGRIGPYWEAVIGLTDVVPQLNLYNLHWPVPTVWDMLPPGKIVTPDRRASREYGNCIISGGCIIDSPRYIDRTSLSRLVRIGQGAVLDGVIAFDRAVIGVGAMLKNTIVEEGIRIPPGVRVGYDSREDEANKVVIDPYHNPSSWYAPIRIVTRNSFA